MPDAKAVLEAFRSRMGAAPTILARAPGRINLIGEHTDYNEGFVLPMSINQATFVALSPREDDQVRVISLDFEGDHTFALGDWHGEQHPHWTRYPRGVMWLLADKGYALSGLNMVMGSELPIGAGVSSSASVEMAVLESLLTLLGVESYTQAEKALMGVEVEHRFVGIPCGVMDQMASAAGDAGNALLIDCRSLETELVAVPEQAAVVVMDTAKKRGLVDSEYGLRRQQCEEAARILGVRALRDLEVADLPEALPKLPPVNQKRVRHVVTEDARTLEAVEAFRAGDLERVGQLFNASHASLRDDYEVSCAELDIMVELAQAQPGCYGARMSGGGFGGCAVALVEREQVADFVAAVGPAYAARTGLTPDLYAVSPAEGSGARRL
ncbi:MAG: galactokinase [Anaerolineae bacterium]|nr:galactokinase [Anaerolineae bacterium]